VTAEPVRPDLAQACAVEVAERLRLYPDAVRAQRIDAQLAQDDTECWDVLAVAFATGARFEALLRDRPGIGCYAIAAALDRALASRARAVERKPDDAATLARRDAVIAVDAAIRRRVMFWVDLNDTLRARCPAAPAAPAIPVPRHARARAA
jgi:hypothetical protein